ncbi:MAG: Holliday junction resolvase RuvX [Candidatus Binataceae bacterium]
MTVAALDVGTKRIGLAISDQSETTALPLGVVERGVTKMDIHEVAARLADRGVALLVVGLPLNMDGSEGPAARQARAFAVRLASELHLKVEMVDERLTSVEARERLARAQVGRERRKRAVDAVAATIILEEWISARRGSR